MANHDYAHEVGANSHVAAGLEPETTASNTLVALTNVAAAAVSMALIAGIGIWGYKLMVRDVTGIPVVRAVEGDMRVRPEDPGGQLAEHQGLAVNEIAAHGEAAGPVNEVRLAPTAVALSSEDQPVQPSGAAAGSAAPLPAQETSVEPSAPEAAEEAAGEDLQEQLRQGEIDQVVAALMAETDPAATRAPMVRVDGAKVVEARPAAARAADVPIAQPAVARTDASSSLISSPGVKQSIRPRVRPRDSALIAQPVSYSEPQASPEIDASAIPSGTRLAQLGAYESPEIARSEWMLMQERFGGILRGKSRVVQEARSGGRTFYRLRAMGFVDLSDARRFCSALSAEGVECIPVQVR
ncbi:MAG: SPOR domain-containing protein [Roseobacter sp.]|jgi:hypothetical protein